MPKGIAIDRDALHRYLYRRADRLGRIGPLNLTELASTLELGYCHLSSILNEMEAEGRLRPIGGSKHRRRTFMVADPATWTRPESWSRFERRRPAG